MIDQGFRHELLRQSHLGLRILAGLELAIAAMVLVARFAEAPGVPGTLRESAIIAVLGFGTLASARMSWSLAHAGLLALISSASLAALLMYNSGSAAAPCLFVMLLTIATLPLRPHHTLLFGLSLAALYALVGSLGAGLDAAELWFIVLLSIVASALTGFLHVQRTSNYHWRDAHPDSAGSLGRLAAAISHELNSPLGALVSAVESLLTLPEKLASAAPEDRPRLMGVHEELRQSIGESRGRLAGLATRLQRLAALESDEIQAVDLNDLLGDVAGLLEHKTNGNVSLELKLEPVPTVQCRPHQLRVAFCNLLENALGAVEQGGRVVVSTRHDASAVEVKIEDNGRGIPASKLHTIFEPGFKVAGGRVSTGNWSLFSSRQIVLQHHGDIRISSARGKGTTVRVMLPL